MFKKSLIFLLIIITLLGITHTNVQAETQWPAEVSVHAPSAIIMEANSGAILYEKNSTEINFPASITKIMTTMLALEYCDLNEVVTFSADAVFKNEGNTSHIARDLNEQMTMEECLYAVMLESANECAYAVAEHVGAKLGGDYQTFVDLMNRRAEELGCTNTHFNNANGLPDENHWTSAHDMALISQAALEQEAFRIIVGSRRYVIPPTNKHKDSTYLNNHHAMIHNYKTSEHLYEYALGGKTGYTEAAGATLVSYAQKGDLTLICVVMHTDTDTYYQDTRNLFEYCFNQFENHNILENQSTAGLKEEHKGFLQSFDSYVTLEEDACITLPKGVDFAEATCNLVTEMTPQGSRSTLEYSYAGIVVGSAEIIPADVSIGDHYFYDKVTLMEGEQKIVKIRPIYLVLGVLFILVIVVFIIFVKGMKANPYGMAGARRGRKNRSKSSLRFR